MVERFLIVGDIHYTFKNTAETQRLYAEVRAQRPLNGCILLGDLLDSPDGKESARLVVGGLKGWVEQLALLCPVYIVLGNHDMYASRRFGSERQVDDSPLTELFSHSTAITVFWRPTAYKLGNTMCLFVPYMSGTASWLECVGGLCQEHKPQVIFSHADLGETAPHCIKYPFGPLCFNGHIHQPSESGQLINLGEAFVHQWERVPYRTRHALLTLGTECPAYTLVPSQQPIKYRPVLLSPDQETLEADLAQAQALGVPIRYCPRFRLCPDQWVEAQQTYSRVRQALEGAGQVAFETPELSSLESEALPQQQRQVKVAQLREEADQAASDYVRCAAEFSEVAAGWDYWAAVVEALRLPSSAERPALKSATGPTSHLPSSAERPALKRPLEDSASRPTSRKKRPLF